MINQITIDYTHLFKSYKPDLLGNTYRDTPASIIIKNYIINLQLSNPIRHINISLQIANHMDVPACVNFI